METAPLPFPRGSCAGDGCPSPETWPLLHVRHRGSFRRLCCSCVLKYHPGSFCSSCFDALDHPSAALGHCSRCPSVCHVSCLPSPSSPFLCPPCSTPNPSSFSFFPTSLPFPLDPSSSRVLLAASRIAFSSMRKAAASFRADAERKMKEFVLMRARTRHILEETIGLTRKRDPPTLDASSVGAKRKPSSDPVAAALAAQRRIQIKEELLRGNADVKVVRSHQDLAVVGNNNAPRGIFSGSANAATLHS